MTGPDDRGSRNDRDDGRAALGGWVRRVWSRLRKGGPASVVSPAARPEPPASPGDGPLPLSIRQEAEWVFHWEAEGNTGNVPLLPRLTGPLNPLALLFAISDVVARHESLRTRFPFVEGEPVQVVEPPGTVLPSFADLGGLDPEGRHAEVLRIEAEAAGHRFDPAGAPPVRLALLRMDPSDHGLLLCIPHLAADLWSLSLLTGDLGALYEALSGGRPAQPPPVRAGQVDHGMRERAHWTAERTASELRRWRRRLAGLAPVPLPADHPRPREHDLACFSVVSDLDPGLSDRLREFSRREGVTLFVTMLAAFHALLARHCSVERPVTYSSSAARRSHAEQYVVGCLSDYLVVVGDCSGDPAFRTLLARTREECLRAHDHQRLPFPYLVAGMDPERELRPHPLKQVGFSLHNTPPATLELSPGITVGDFGVEIPECDENVMWTADLVVEAYDYGSGPIQFDVTLSGRLFETVAGWRWTERYRRVLEQVVREPGARLSRLDVLLDEERTPARAAVAAPAGEGTVAGLLARRLDDTPDAVAVDHAGRQLSFGGLARRAREVAALLGARTRPTGRPVLVLLDDLQDRIVATAAVLLAGGIPVDGADHRWSPGRFRRLVAALGTPAAITAGTSAGAWGVPERNTVDVAADVTAAAPRTTPSATSPVAPPASSPARPSSTPPAAPHPGLAAAVEPSGADGRWVVLPHRALAAEAAAFASAARLGPGSRFAPLGERGGTAAAVTLAILSGATLVFPRRGPGDTGVCDVPRGVTAMGADPERWWNLLASGVRAGGGVDAWCGRAPVPARLVAALAAAGFRVWGGHGWPEVGETLTAARLDEGTATERGVGELGLPAAGREVSVAGEAGLPAPAGVAGALTAPVAGLGYLADPRATAERFVPDPAGTGTRRHRSAHRGFRTNQGVFHLAGPLPGYVSLDGGLLETEVLERALTETPGVSAAVVTAGLWPTPSGMAAPALVAWIAGDRMPAEEEVRERVRGGPVGGRVPRVVVWVPPDRLERARALRDAGRDPLPSLPGPDEAVLLPQGSAPPRTVTERRLAVLWAEVLGTGDVRRADHFFRAGGTPRQAVRLLRAVAGEWGVTVPLGDFLAAPRLAELAASIDLPGRGPSAEYSPAPDPLTNHPKTGKS
ncbi:hypothetical protein GCM10017673_31700 [Streptosporangium violaceochromogenes]|nr:hypothetical protein GCM10017673_31700 [Streptosporangium violaceochromogenes]